MADRRSERPCLLLACTLDGCVGQADGGCRGTAGRLGAPATCYLTNTLQKSGPRAQNRGRSRGWLAERCGASFLNVRERDPGWWPPTRLSPRQRHLQRRFHAARFERSLLAFPSFRLLPGGLSILVSYAPVLKLCPGVQKMHVNS
eukprot:235272-Chlamydomonas_euryale.AAC.2